MKPYVPVVVETVVGNMQTCFVSAPSGMLAEGHVLLSIKRDPASERVCFDWPGAAASQLYVYEYELYALGRHSITLTVWPWSYAAPETPQLGELAETVCEKGSNATTRSPRNMKIVCLLIRSHIILVLY